MIDSKTAFEIAKNHEQINKIKAEIDETITEAIKRGEFSCTVLIRVDTKDAVRSQIKEWVESFGYEIKIPPRTYEDYISWDQAKHYDDIKISWIDG